MADIAGGSEHYLDTRVLEVVQDGEDRLELGDAFALAAEWVIRSSMLLTCLGVLQRELGGGLDSVVAVEQHRRSDGWTINVLPSVRGQGDVETGRLLVADEEVGRGDQRGFGRMSLHDGVDQALASRRVGGELVDVEELVAVGLAGQGVAGRYAPFRGGSYATWTFAAAATSAACRW